MQEIFKIYCNKQRNIGLTPCTINSGINCTQNFSTCSRKQSKMCLNCKKMTYSCTISNFNLANNHRNLNLTAYCKTELFFPLKTSITIVFLWPIIWQELQTILNLLSIDIFRKILIKPSIIKEHFIWFWTIEIVKIKHHSIQSTCRSCLDNKYAPVELEPPYSLPNLHLIFEPL